MTAEILCVGTELLLGQVLDTNSRFLSRQLSALGVDVFHHTTVGDNRQRMSDAMLRAMMRSDVVLISGGLGPTFDDITKEVLAEALGRGMALHEPSRDAIAAYFVRHGRAMTPNNLRQAMFPEGAEILPNRHGTAPGCVVRQADKTVVVLPGPPRELQGMFFDHVEGILKGLSREVITSRILRVFGVGESVIEHRLHDLMETSTNPTLAPYAGSGECTLRMTVKQKEGEDPQALFAPMEAAVRALFGDAVYGVGEDELPAVVGRMLIERGLTLAMAESCTGGRIADALVGLPGISATLLEAHVVYANAAKTRVLGVPEALIARHGAVSEEVACAMARGAREVSGADIGVSTTGIAGPGGGTEEKPVGLVYVGVADRGGVTATRLTLGDRGRAYVREMASLNALNLVRLRLLCEARAAVPCPDARAQMNNR